MDKFKKISEILALKRSQAEHAVVKSDLSLLALDKELETMKNKIYHISSDMFSGETYGDLICDALMQEKWHMMMLKKIHITQIERKDLIAKLGMEKEVLKEVL